MKSYIYLVLLGCDHINWTYPISAIVGLNSVCREILSSVIIVFLIKSEDGIKRRGDFFWSVVDFSFEKDTIGHIFTGQYYGLHYHHYWRGVLDKSHQVCQ